MHTFVFVMAIVLSIGCVCDIIELVFNNTSYDGLQTFNVAFRSILLAWSLCLLLGVIA